MITEGCILSNGRTMIQITLVRDGFVDYREIGVPYQSGTCISESEMDELIAQEKFVRINQKRNRVEEEK